MTSPNLTVARTLWANQDNLNLPQGVSLVQDIIQPMLHGDDLGASDGCPICGGTDLNSYIGGFTTTEADIEAECNGCTFMWNIHMVPAHR